MNYIGPPSVGHSPADNALALLPPCDNGESQLRYLTVRMFPCGMQRCLTSQMFGLSPAFSALQTSNEPS
jgi:hypothetical protein